MIYLPRNFDSEPQFPDLSNVLSQRMWKLLPHKGILSVPYVCVCTHSVTQLWPTLL